MNIKTDKRADASRLTRDDWLDCAFKAVVEGGFGDVRVLVLADRLGVTRGSFYWHFADHAELVRALLARWKTEEEARLQAAAVAGGDDPRGNLDGLLDHALKRGGRQLENTRFELALRGLARRDALVAALLHDIDVQRLKLFEGKFRSLTADDAEARERSTLFYLGIVGCMHALADPGAPSELQQHLQALLSKYLFDPLTQHALA